LTDHLAGRLRHVGIKARTVELKIRSSDFQTRHRGQALPEATNLTEMLWQTAREIFERGVTDDLFPIRLLGVGATRLTRDSIVQRDLFDGGERARQQSLDETIDEIRKQHGSAAVRRGSFFGRSKDAEP
jgi:DNA polymerase IV